MVVVVFVVVVVVVDVILVVVMAMVEVVILVVVMAMVERSGATPKFRVILQNKTPSFWHCLPDNSPFFVERLNFECNCNIVGCPQKRQKGALLFTGFPPGKNVSACGVFPSFYC